MSQPAVAESLRLIQVFSYPPTPAGSKPVLPNTVTEMFLRELTEEPHHNDFYCNKCRKEYPLVGAYAEGTTCTQRPKGVHVCTGKITRRWTKEKTQVELQRLMVQGGVTIAWELGEPSVPIGLAVCEAHRSESVIAAIDFPMSVLSEVYGKLGRQEPFLILSHLWIDRVAQIQETELMRQLVWQTVEPVMRANTLTIANVLVPMSSHDSELRRTTLRTMLHGKQKVLLGDQRPNRHRELWGFQLKLHDD